MASRPARFFVVMGVSGCGKSTVGRLLAEQLGCEFLDGDDFHPEENVRKMASGRPLDDDDRASWLTRLSELREQYLARESSGVLACSALKKAYRQQIRGDDPRVIFVYLRGSEELIASRMAERQGHFMPPGLLRSQFDALEEPKQALVVDILPPPEEVVRVIVEKAGFASLLSRRCIFKRQEIAI